VRLRVPLLVVALACLLAVPAAQAKSTTVRKQQGTITTTRLADGVRHLKFRWGPIKITPGQNTISLADDKLLPPGPGWITSFKPDLTYVDGKVPRVDIIHLHHAVWVVTGPANGLRPTWAAGEEKTIFRTPKGFGWRYRTSDHWLLNHMIHNLTPAPTKVFITWEMDFIPLGARAARGMQEVKTQWLDVEGLQAYPVFDALQGTGVNGQFTYPDDKPDAYAGIAPRNQWVVDHDATLVGTAGHLHPGGLWTDLKLTRDGRTVEVFRSRAKYFEPAGAVSWDVAMTATPPTWKVAVKKGDVLSVSGTYDTRSTSWYEVMAIMPVAITNVPAGGVDPFLVNTAVPGVLTHGHLPENDHHGAGAAGRPPVVSVGQPLTFVNDDASRNIFHTITACRAPCTATTGIAFPLANGPVAFDSGELGYGPAGFTAASNRKQWQTPTDLGAGTYTYFCRIHPFMRGAFRVKG
jgi:plastocyanin